VHEDNTGIFISWHDIFHILFVFFVYNNMYGFRLVEMSFLNVFVLFSEHYLGLQLLYVIVFNEALTVLLIVLKLCL